MESVKAVRSTSGLKPPASMSAVPTLLTETLSRPKPVQAVKSTSGKNVNFCVSL
jgi:hypothetical protein